MVTVGYSRLQQVTEWLQCDTAGYSRFRSGYSGLQQVKTGFMSGYSGLQQVTAGYRVVAVGYRRLQKVTEWLQWVTAGYSRLPRGYNGL